MKALGSRQLAIVAPQCILKAMMYKTCFNNKKGINYNHYIIYINTV